MAHLSFISGGSRSGKSTHAVTLAINSTRGARRYFIATAEALDDEMRARIAHHRSVRSDDFITIEEPIAIGEAIGALEGRADVAVIDCLTLWIANLMGRGLGDDTIMRDAVKLAEAMRAASFATIVVSGEVGSGIVPDNAESRRFRDLLGWTNQTIARAADEALLMVAGYPIRLK